MLLHIMPLYLTAAHSSRIQKPGKRTSPGDRTTTAKRSSRSSANKRPRNDDDDDDEAPLDGTGKILHTVSESSVGDVMEALDYTTRIMFSEIPERAGMNSTRIAAVLNFRRSLPPLVTIAHVHALLSAASRTEREIVSLVARGTIRKIQVGGRGNDISGLSDVLISRPAFEELLNSSGLDAAVVTDVLVVLRANPRSTAISSRSLPPSHVSALTKAGLLVTPSLRGSRNVSLSGSALVASPSVSRAASGTLAAVGGDSAFENLGGVGSPRKSASHPADHAAGNDLVLSVPNIGSYLRLVDASRTHLLELLDKSKYREAPLYLLRERWDGAVDSDSRISTAKRVRGEFSTVLPAKTKKWKDLYGLDFDWTLQECLGAGLIELFETHSVGLGVRALT